MEDKVLLVIDHYQKRAMGRSGFPVGSGLDWFEIREAIKIKFDALISVSKKSATELTMVGFAPRLKSLAISKLWSTRSKAFL